MADGKPLYRHVAARLLKWAEPHRSELGYSLVGAVVGATYPEQLAELRCATRYPFPGARLRDTGAPPPPKSRARLTPTASVLLINNSRGITFAYERPAYHARFGDDWQSAIAQAVGDMIDDLAANTSAGLLPVSSPIDN